MMPMLDTTLRVAQMVVPAILTAFLGIIINNHRKDTERREERDTERQKAQEQRDILLFRGLLTNASLSRAVAIAQRDGKCNGETKRALEEADEAIPKLQEFLIEQGIKSTR